MCSEIGERTFHPKMDHTLSRFWDTLLAIQYQLVPWDNMAMLVVPAPAAVPGDVSVPASGFREF